VEQAESTLSSLEAWRTAGLRLTAFPSHPVRADQVGWWGKLTGEEPDYKRSLRKRGEHREQGQFKNSLLTLQVQPDRIDWALTGADEEDQETVPTVGALPGAIDGFLDLMLSWLDFDDLPPLQRLAFGATLEHRVEDQTQGIEWIAKYLPSVSLGLEDLSDLVYQINRPRSAESPVNGLRINRLCKWAVVNRVGGFVKLGPDSARFERKHNYWACVLDLDINTVAGSPEELPTDSLSQVFTELVELGKQVAAEGDKP